MTFFYLCKNLGYGKIFEKSRADCKEGNAQEKAWQTQNRNRQESDQSKAGDSHRPVRSQKKRRESSKEKRQEGSKEKRQEGRKEICKEDVAEKTFVIHRGADMFCYA